MLLDSSGDLKYEIPLVSPNNDRVIRMFPGASRDIRDSALMPPAVREAAANGVLRLEDLLVLGQAASVTVYVLGYDEFSGARRLFKSKHYRLADVTDGTFQGLRVVGSEVTTKHSAQSNEEPRSGA
jgi:hypothetical protein